MTYLFEKLNVTELVLEFREVLLAGLALEGKLTESARAGTNMYADWAQATWEMIVEAGILSNTHICLDIYGDGADCNGASSRVLFPESSALYEVRCFPVSEQVVQNGIGDGIVEFPLAGHRFTRFVSAQPYGYSEGLPLDCVLLLDGLSDSWSADEFIVPSKSVFFFVVPKRMLIGAVE